MPKLRNASRYLLAVWGLFCTNCAHSLHDAFQTERIATGVSVPSRIDADQYETARAQYDALPLNAAERDPFRHALITYLYQSVVNPEQFVQPERQEPISLDKAFTESLALYDPIEVNVGIKPIPPLVALTQKVHQTYAAQGNESYVALALAVQLSMRPDQSSQLLRKLDDVLAWLDQTDQISGFRLVSGLRATHLLERTADTWPISALLSRLRLRYKDRNLTASTLLRGDLAKHMGGNPQDLPETMTDRPFSGGFNLARLYLTTGQPQQALQTLREFPGLDPQEQPLLDLVNLVVSQPRQPDHRVALAKYLAQKSADPRIPLRICMHAAVQFPDSAQVHTCVGRIASELDRIDLAITSLRRAYELDGQNKSLASLLAQLYQRQIFRAVEQESLPHAQQLTTALEVFYKKLTDNKSEIPAPLQRNSLARIYYVLAHGLYNAGQIPQALQTLEKSISMQSSTEALWLRALIGSKMLEKTQHGRALNWIAQALRSVSEKKNAEGIYWSARLQQLRGNLLSVSGTNAEAIQAHQRAVMSWKIIASLSARPDARAEALIYLARSLYALKLIDQGILVLEKAIDVNPARKETYADAIALMVTNGQLPEALDAYHRALGREEVSEYLKAYCSIWVILLARKANLPPDPLAIDFLSRLAGQKKWYATLASAVVGKTDWTTLSAQAKTAGQRAEVAFYSAEIYLAQNQPDKAQVLWREVVRSGMMAFFEYDMALHNLRYGPSSVSTTPIERQQQTGPTNNPAESI